MRKFFFLDITLDNNIKFYMKGDQAYIIYSHELQSFQDCVSSCTLRYVDISIYRTRHILHVLGMNKYIILWHMKYQMWRCQLHVWMSSELIKLFARYLISPGLTLVHDIIQLSVFIGQVRNILSFVRSINSWSFNY